MATASTVDQHADEARRAFANLAESTIAWSRQLTAGRTNAEYYMRIDFTHSGWWFSYELFGQTARCTSCPTGF